MSEPLDWSYRVTEIPEGGLRQTREASDAERAQLAADLDILGCRRLVADFTIRATGQGHYRLKGSIVADLTQACVVTLEPVEQRALGDFDAEFWPAVALPETGEDELEALSAAEIEPIVHGRIDAGRIVFETLSAAVDPYPRQPGAEFSPEAASTAAPSDLGPFAALKKLKGET